MKFDVCCMLGKGLCFGKIVCFYYFLCLFGVDVLIYIFIKCFFDVKWFLSNVYFLIIQSKVWVMYGVDLKLNLKVLILNLYND